MFGLLLLCIVPAGCSYFESAVRGCTDYAVATEKENASTIMLDVWKQKTCDLVITTTSDLSVKVTLNYYMAASHNDCEIAKTDVYTHLYNEQEYHLVTWCGDVTRNAFYSWDNYIRVRGPAYTPVKVTYVAVEKKACDSQLVGHSIYSRGFPTVYDQDMQCIFVIKKESRNDSPIHLNFTHVEFLNSPNCSNGNIKIYTNNSVGRQDELATVCNVTALDFNIKALAVVYRTGYGKAMFKLEYDQQETCQHVFTADKAERMFTSENFPHLQSYHKCTYLITGESEDPLDVLHLHITYSDMKSPCRHDYIHVYDGACETRLEAVNPLRGLEETHYIFPPVFGRLGTFEFRKKALCTWHIVGRDRVFMEITKSTVSCDTSKLLISTGEGRKTRTFCDAPKEMFMSEGPSLNLTMTNQEGANVAFRIKYWNNKMQGCSNGTQVIKPEAYIRKIESPGYPYGYPANMECRWRIETDQSTRKVELNIESKLPRPSDGRCDSDYLEVDTGAEVKKLCGWRNFKKLRSDKNKISIRFVSDKVESDRGFDISYSYVYVGPSRTHAEGKIETGYVIGFCVAAVGIILTIVFVVYMKRRHTSSATPTQSRERHQTHEPFLSRQNSRGGDSTNNPLNAPPPSFDSLNPSAPPHNPSAPPQEVVSAPTQGGSYAPPSAPPGYHAPPDMRDAPPSYDECISKGMAIEK